jgi:molybdopterin/thiamine biosynthesis adenylyltransferase
MANTRIEPIGGGAARDALFSRERLAGYSPHVLSGGTVLVSGVGALGQNLTMPLALSGIGEFGLVDFDSWEAHNRTRSPLYPSEEERKLLGNSLKAPHVAARLRRLSTAKVPRVGFYVGRIQEAANALIAGADVTVGCVDSIAARAFLMERTRLLGKPFIEGGFDGLHINMTVFPNSAEDEPCWLCGKAAVEEGPFSCRLYSGAVEAEGMVPAVQSAAGTLGHLMAEAVIAALHGEFPLGGRRLLGNVRTGAFRTIEMVADPQCRGIHGRFGVGAKSVEARAGSSVRELLEALGPRFREPTVRLPRPFVWSAPCRSCGEMVRVRSPAWALSGLTCRGCGGEFEFSGDSHSLSLTELSGEVPEGVMGLACREVGLGPASVFEAFGESGTSAWLRLGDDPGGVLDFSGPAFP